MPLAPMVASRFFFQAEDGIRYIGVTGVQTCALPILDDEEIMRDVLETLLSAEGYRVDLAKTGEEGLEAYGRRTYDVVLLDVSMPGMGGLRALEEILKADSEAVVVMITAYATFDTAIGAWERGAAGCIRKPFQNEQIVSTVAAGIRRRRKEEERDRKSVV